MMRSFHSLLTGQLDKAVTEAVTARAIQQRTQLADDWNPGVPLILLSVYALLQDGPAVEREAAAALAMPGLTDPARLLLVPGTQALAWFEAGRLADAAKAASAAHAQAQRLGFDRHFFAVDPLRVLAGLALERRDLDTAEELTERALSIAEGRRPASEFLALLDQAQVWAARGQVHEALATIEAARRILTGTHSVLLGSTQSRRAPVVPLTEAELRVLKLLPISSHLQIANTLYVSRNTVKTHLRAVYQKLGVTSRSDAIRRAIDLRLL
jgi:ATP/maltotriose-dependent transcriptional regulator MalT